MEKQEVEVEDETREEEEGAHDAGGASAAAEAGRGEQQGKAARGEQQSERAAADADVGAAAANVSRVAKLSRTLALCACG